MKLSSIKYIKPNRSLARNYSSKNNKILSRFNKQKVMMTAKFNRYGYACGRCGCGKYDKRSIKILLKDVKIIDSENNVHRVGSMWVKDFYSINRHGLLDNNQPLYMYVEIVGSSSKSNKNQGIKDFTVNVLKCELNNEI